jgi:hypothetical protein
MKFVFSYQQIMISGGVQRHIRLSILMLRECNPSWVPFLTAFDSMHSFERPIVTQGELADKYDKASMLDFFCDITFGHGSTQMGQRNPLMHTLPISAGEQLSRPTAC